MVDLFDLKRGLDLGQISAYLQEFVNLIVVDPLVYLLCETQYLVYALGL